MIRAHRPRFSPPMRLSMLLLALLVLTGCGRTASWAVNVGVDDGRIETRTYDAQRRLALDVHRPSATRAPVVVYLHGGSWRTGRRTDARFIGQRLADAGALVLVPDYRKAPSHAFPDFMHDAARAVAWARANAASLGGDPERIFVMGHSAGAHIAALLATDARFLAAEGIAPGDLAGVIGWSGAYDFLPITDIDLVDVFGTGELWPVSQPVNHVDGDEPPFLLVHGTDDEVTLPRNSSRLRDKLAAAGVRVRYVPLEGRGHLAPLLDLKRPGGGEALAETLRFLGLD